MTDILITTDQKINLMRSFIASIGDLPHYVFLGEHVAANTTETLVDKPQDITDIYRTMIVGKKVANSDVSLVIRNIPYETNKVFDVYDNADDYLIDKDFYAIVDEGSYFHCYKCLDNNDSANSTVEPDFSHVSGSNTTLYQTSDGYRWKYMFSVSSTVVDKFSDVDFFPVVANSSTTTSAVPGSIDIILFDNVGQGYNNYLSDTFISADIRIGGNSQIYKVSAQTTVNGFFTGCMLYISSGSGAGEYRTINDYYSNSSGSYIVLDEVLSTVTNGSEFEITPTVLVTGSNDSGNNAIARALVNSSSGNSLYRVEMLDRGSFYSYASASATANVVVGVLEEAELRVVLPPALGHGYDAVKELYCNTLSLSLSFTNSESNTIVTTNDFRQIGLIKNPLFANVYLTMSNTSGPFTAGESIFKINPLYFGTASINTTSANVTFSNGDYISALAANTLLYLVDANNAYYQLAYVNTVTNSTSIILKSNGFFACTTTSVYIANITANAIVSNVVNQNNIYVTNSSPFSTDDVVVGLSSGAKGTITTITRNGNTKAFSTFLNMHKYELTPLSGDFAEDEIVFCTDGVSNTATAFVHSTLNNGAIIYTTNNTGLFLSGGTNTMIGATSNASAYIIGTYCPELVLGSGDILYAENINAVSRTANTESVLLFLEF